jgi:hypothetical protein
MFIQVRYGFGTANDSTGALPVVASPYYPAVAPAPATVDTIPLTYANRLIAAPAGKCFYPLIGEHVVQLPPVTRSAGYFIFNLPDPPLGATYCSVRLRPGATYFYTTATVDAWGKGTMRYRADLFGGR